MNFAITNGVMVNGSVARASTPAIGRADPRMATSRRKGPDPGKSTSKRTGG